MTSVTKSHQKPVGRSRGRFGPFPFATILAICMGGLVTAAVAVVLGLQLWKIGEATFELLNDKTQYVIDKIETGLRDQLEPAATLSEAVARRIEDGTYDLGDAPRLGDLLRGSIAATPHVSFIGAFDLDYRVVGVERQDDGSVEPVLPDVGSKLLLERMMAELDGTQGAFWGEPVITSGGSAVVNLRRALRRDGALIGLLATAITVPELSELVTEAGDRFGATAFILYGRDRVLAHPNLFAARPSGPLDSATVALGDVGDIVLAGLWDGEPAHGFAQSATAGVEVVKVRIGDQAYVILYKWLDDFGAVPWALGVWFPLADVTDHMARLKWAASAGAAVLVIALLLALFLGRRIARPVRRFASSAARVGALDLAQVERLPESSFREFNDQAQAFNAMLTSLRSFETYVPRSLVTRLIREGEDQAVKSVERELTVMFTDVVGFTTMAEGMEAGEVAGFLNHHFALLGACVEAEGGTLDKYIGDAVMAFWGAPEKQKDRAVRACRAALAMAAALEADNAERAAQGLAPVRIRIGIHTGTVVVGNIGWPGRINYTIVGDTVNACQRLEVLGKEMDRGETATILISDITAERLDADFKTEPAGSFAVKGRSEPIEVYRLIP